MVEDIPANSVVGGEPAKVICSMDEYLNKRKIKYPEALAPKGQVTSKEMEGFLWEQFLKDRE